MLAICPKCNGSIEERIGLKSMKAVSPNKKMLSCVAYTCPTCSVILSVQADPLALSGDLVDAIMKRLGRG